MFGLAFVVWWLIGCSHQAPVDPTSTPTPGPAKATPAALLLTVSPVDEPGQAETDQLVSMPVTTTEILATKQPDVEIRLAETGQPDDDIVTVEAEAGSDDGDAIRMALVEKTGIPADKLEFAVTQNSGVHARGTLKHKDDPGGGYFIAAKADNRWVIVYDGQATPACAAIAPYDFPVDMAPECLDGANHLVVRATDGPRPSGAGTRLELGSEGVALIGVVENVSLSARIITLQAPVQGFGVVALTEESELFSPDGDEITLRSIEPGVRIEVSGVPGDSAALLASQVRVLP
jgi:hypothetical protein